MQTTHVANPVAVNATVILEVAFAPHRCVLRLSDGRNFDADHATMCARHTPVVGDYLVTQEDGYEYINPKDVFERKYHPISVADTSAWPDASAAGAADTSTPAPEVVKLSRADQERLDQIRTNSLNVAHAILGAVPAECLIDMARKIEAFYQGEVLPPIPVAGAQPQPVTLNQQASAATADSGLYGTFGYALHFLKMSERVRRASWADGQWAMLNAHSTFDLPIQLRVTTAGKEESLMFYTGELRNLLFKGSGNGSCECSAWTPTDADILADDWSVVL